MLGRTKFLPISPWSNKNMFRFVEFQTICQIEICLEVGLACGLGLNAFSLVYN